MSLNTSKTREAFAKARTVMPLGVTSNVRYWGDETPVVDRAQGAYIWDMDGNRFIDYRLAFGPIILGHAHPTVNRCVGEQLSRGTVYAHTHMLEVEVAERIVRMCPAVERVRFANSGTEATMHALRIARGYTGRERVLKFEGQYHGFHDYLLWSTGSPLEERFLGPPRNPTPLPISAGIPRGLVEYIVVAPFNDGDTLARIVREQWYNLAAIIVEPILGNGGTVMPAPGFLEQIRALCDEYGIVMIMDEVKTGFRLAKGGAAEYFGVEADLSTYAKSLANGFPLAAIGGRSQIMDVIGGAGVGQGGTYCGNAVGTAAANATLEILETTDALATIERNGQRLMDGIGEVLTEAGIEYSLNGIPAMFDFLLGSSTRPQNYRDVIHSDFDLYRRIAAEMRMRGVEYEADPRDPLFVCAAHTAEDVDETLNRFNDAVKGAIMREM
jgi:glutamate-1-semialdehyde 2,1-aminomutase